jgi:hypothetical protein
MDYPYDDDRDDLAALDFSATDQISSAIRAAHDRFEDSRIRDFIPCSSSGARGRNWLESAWRRSAIRSPVGPSGKNQVMKRERRHPERFR